MSDPTKYNKIILTIKSIASISGIDDKSVESFLYVDGRYPSMFTLYACIKFVRCSRGIVPRECLNLALTFEEMWNRKGRRIAGKFTIAGAKRLTKSYMLKGEMLTIQQISEKEGIKYITLCKRIASLGIIEGDDCLAAVNYVNKRRGKNNAK